LCDEVVKIIAWQRLDEHASTNRQG
jgi:hypothetical protein